MQTTLAPCSASSSTPCRSRPAPAAVRRQQRHCPAAVGSAAASGVARRARRVVAAAQQHEPGSAAAAAAMPEAIMRQLAACFSEDLKMTNGCLPASLLLRDVLASLGVQCRLRSGYFVVTLPDEGSPPPLYAAAHMWVEVQPGDGSGSGATTLDIGLALAEAAGVTTASYQLSTELPPGAQRVDDFQGADMMEAVMAAMADGADAGPYWAGAPPALQQFRAAMLQRFGA